jgi:hypothetical protein
VRPICPRAGSVLARVFFRRPRAAVKTGSDSLDHCGSAPSEEITDRKECRQGPRRTISCSRGTADKRPGRQAGSVPAGGNQRELHCAGPARVAGGRRCCPAVPRRFSWQASVGAPARYIASTCQVHFRADLRLSSHQHGRHRATDSGACAGRTRSGQRRRRAAQLARRHGGVRPGIGGRGIRRRQHP